MAVLVAAGGALLGGAIGIGPSAGWIVGSIIGSLLFPAQGEDTVVEGPRLGDLTVTSSAYGASIPIGYGTVRLAGNMIWSLEIEEIKNEKKESQGKGGGGASQTTITYEYFGTFAIAFAEGPADQILRMWADGKLIYDKRGTGDDITKVRLDFRFYRGTETQVQDSIIQDDKGNDTPAYRGLCYIVFDRLPLKDFGNRIPNITAELTFKGQSDQPFIDLDPITVQEGGDVANVNGELVAVDYQRGLFYFTNPSVTAEENYLRRVNTRTMKEDKQVQLSSYISPTSMGVPGVPTDVSSLRVHSVAPTGYILASVGTGNNQPLALINPDSLQFVSSFGASAAGFNNNPEFFEALGDGKSSWITTGTRTFFLTGSVFNSVGLLEVTNNIFEYLWDSDNYIGQEEPRISTVDRVIGTCPGAIGDGFGEGYYLGGSSYGAASSDNVILYRLRVLDSAFFNLSALLWVGIEDTIVMNLTPGQLIPDETQLNNVIGPIYDETDDTVMFQITDSSNNDWMIKYNPNSREIVWRTQIPQARNEFSGFNQSRITGNVYGQMDLNNGWALQTSTGEVIYNEGGWGQGHITTGSSWWDGRTNTYIGVSTAGFTKWLFFRGLGLDETIQNIVDDLVSRSGLSPSEVDTTQLSSLTVPGYLVSRQSTIRGAIQPLAQVFFFDGIESDYQLKFLVRDGKSTAATIAQNQLAVLDNESGEFFRENRTQEVELPLRFAITYMDQENDYQQQTHSAKRILAPAPSMNSRNEMGVQIAAVLDAVVAKQAAEKSLFTAWIERSNYEFRLPWTYLALDPSDIAQINMDDGTIFRTRLLQTDVGTGYSIDVSALSEEAAQYVSTVEADSGAGPLQQEFLSETLTKLVVMCSPLLRDSDDTARTTSVLYFFMGGYGQPGWTAASLFKSAEGTEYEEVGSTINEMIWGTASNALGDTDDPFSNDETNTLTVFMNTGADQLASVTQLEMVNGANAAALIDADGNPEIIQFRDVTVNPDGSRTLGGLLRGRRGSETFTGGHNIGDVFVLLTPATGSTIQLTLSERNQDRFYRAVTSGQLFEDALSTVKASPANDLKPYAVVSQKAEASGNDIVLTWQRRTRIGGGLQDGLGDVPLAEDNETYEIDVIDGGNPTTNSPYQVTDATTFTYSSAQQTADGFTPPLSQITVRIYQISAQVGRGFVKEVTLDVE